MLRRSFLGLLVCFFAALASLTADQNLPRVQATLAQLPLHFEANLGQWNPEIRYAARSQGQAIFFTEHGPVLNAKSRRIDISLVHSNPSPVIEALDPLPGRTNYFVGARSSWRAGVRQYERIAYRSVYPGIDVIYYGARNQLEYDLVLRPGADPRLIEWSFRGADYVSLTAEGDLVITSGEARFVQRRPVVLQQDHPVESRYSMPAGGTVRLALGAYDRSKPLVIDPVLAYSSFLGGGATDVITALKIDFRGRMYVAGYTTNSDLPANAIQAADAGGTDCFVAIVDPRFSGPASLPFLTFLGGGREDSCTALELDSAGNIYVTGTTTSSDFPLAGNSVQTSLHLSTTNTVFQADAFITEMSSDPANPGIIYSTYFGGTGQETPHGITVDKNGFIYVMGTTTSSDMAVTDSAAAGVLWGPSDLFFLKLDPNATAPVYSSYLGGEDREDGRGLAVSDSGLVYFAASTFSSLFPLAGNSYNPNLPGAENIIIGVLDMTQSGQNSLVYATYFGGSVLDEVRKIALDAQGRLLVTGWTLSSDFPTTPGAMQPKPPANPSSGDVFIARVNPLASPGQFLEYSTYLGGSDADVAYDITSDAAGSIYTAGYTLSTDFPVTADAAQSQFYGGVEAFVVKLNPAVAGSRALQYATYFGQNGVHVITGLAVGADGSIYVAGYTTAAFQVTGSAFENVFAGGASDGFAVALQ